ncbi:hypothetical protein JRO89_XS11G0226700 [Xanthoceras sorbifolium]|uniref:non-specific serine/threonine protein kinase n=1 Tax=Xanthoceras sorbifolium TaxID=99658 RepID=A0ABQ8HGY1_9ROSI|nr:hypothetical protein JRO89_XS11G0226700 [Xanthoceras sorbifolium]
MEAVWASDTELTGRIPDFIGNWSKLKILRFQGNSFNGPIPSSFSNLTALLELRISDLSNGSSTLAFIKDMKSLRALELRNNNISDSIPSNIGEYQSLQHLDLSFNNLGGDIPDSLFNLSSLTHLFLGDNKLNDYNFSIKCGGPQITSSNGIVYERDNAIVGPASYFVTDTSRWGVSNVGYFTGNNNPSYTSASSSQFTNTLDSKLFQTARVSASSLRYYGLGLENGNYTVTLHFAEMAILDTTSWQSVGRRIFDIYIQGNRVAKDFNIKQEAGGVSKRAIQRQFTAQVSENYLEIHLIWAGKGTCCIPDQGTYGPSIAAISATPDFIPTVSNNPPVSNKRNRTGLISGIVVGVGLGSFLLVLTIFWIVRRRKRPTDDDEVLVKGKLGDGRVIAVKQLSVASHQGKSQFVAEIVAISAVQHRNLVKLYGCCIEGSERLLVYEYLENKSLDQALFGETSLNFNCGYLAPEYAMRGHLTEKTDVFAFGVVVLEMVSGRPNSGSSLDEEQVYLLEWAWNLHENNCEVELVDSRLPNFNEEEVKRMIGVGLLCTQTLSSLRPPMSRVVAMLCGDMEVSQVTTKPGYLTDWKYDDTTDSFISSDKATIGTDTSNYISSSTMVPEALQSPGNDTKPILHDISDRRGVAQLLKKGYSLSFKNNGCTILDSMDYEVVKVKMCDNSFPVSWNQVNHSALVSKHDDSILWHNRYGNFNMNALKYLQSHDMVRDMHALTAILAATENQNKDANDIEDQEDESDSPVLRTKLIDHGEVSVASSSWRWFVRRVWKAFNKHSGEVVAIKMLREKFHSWEECLSLEEIKSLKILRHPNIVLLKEVIRTRDSSLFFVFEYMDGSLLQVMRSRLCRFSENEVRHWCFQVLQGLHYMHENGYFHRDLKPENLLVFKDLIKIGDMGSAREINSSQPCTDNVTTRWYRAPEVMLGLENYSFKVDMWAMGAIVAELFMFKPLFPGTNVPDQMLKICNVLGSPTTDSWLEGLVLASGLNYQFPQSTGVNFSLLMPSASENAAL